MRIIIMDETNPNRIVDEIEIGDYLLDKCNEIDKTVQLDEAVSDENNTTIFNSNANNKKRNDCKNKSAEAIDRQQLGSLTTYNCQRTRTSARVIQKMKQDQQITMPNTPPLAAASERDGQRKDERQLLAKTATQLRTNKASWSNLERNHFFDALNELGKDFEAIGNYINSKLKRRTSALDDTFKTKDQVRQHYYQTYHKLCKYIRFSEEVRKPVQELYALINYGEMRRKLQFVTEKHFMKFRNLVYNGYITVRSKGKNIRIKTPSCKTLRRLNQLDDSLEDIKLPSKIEVIISPANIEAFGRVQSIAQNPRCRTTVPLHKKLVNFIKAFQCKWRSAEALLIDEAKLSTNNEQQIAALTNEINYIEPEICFLPKPGVTIHRPLLSITECLSSVNICLTAYEERMGVTVKGETLNTERPTTTAICPLTAQTSVPVQCNGSNKRLCLENPIGDKRPTIDLLKRFKQTYAINDCELSLMTSEETVADTEIINHRNESSSDELGDDIHGQTPLTNGTNDLPSDNMVLNANGSKKAFSSNPTQQQSCIARSKRVVNTKPLRPLFKPLVNEDVIQRIRSGWTISTAADITIGDLYVILGHDSKLELNYYWLPETTLNTFDNCLNSSNIPMELQSVGSVDSNKILTPSSITTNSLIKNEENSLLNSISKSSLSNKLKHLLLVANLSDRLRKRTCNCERSSHTKYKIERDFTNRSFVANKTYEHSVGSYDYEANSSNNFRQPKIPNRRLPVVDPVKQLANLNRQKLSKQVLVQRFLLPNNGIVNSSEHNAQLKQEHKEEIKQDPIRNIQHNKEIVKQEATENTLQNTSPTHQNESIILPSMLTEDRLLNSKTTGVDNRHNEPPMDTIDNEMLIKMNTTPSSSTSNNNNNNNFDESSNTSFLNGLCPMQLLRDTTSNSRWLEENLNDFSLTSLLGHLDEANSTRDILDAPSNISIISESSVDYMHKFQEIKALLPFHDRD